MMLRAKLLFAQLPLAAALILVGFVAVRTTQTLGSGAQAILQDNYRSVLAAQRMKDSLETLDGAAATLVVGRSKRRCGALAGAAPALRERAKGAGGQHHRGR